MKTFGINFLVLVAFSLLFLGCSSNDEIEPAKNMSDLNVPEGFAFETTHLVQIIAQSPAAGTMVITQQNGAQVYKGFIDPEQGVFDRKILLPTNITSLDFSHNGEVIHRNIAPDSQCFYLTFTGNSRMAGDQGRIDSDGDGVPDDEDDFPFDPELAYLIEYPPQDTTRCRNYGTLAFEDRWPSEGDYDFNDVILNYYIYECTNRHNTVRQIYFYLYYSVDGAGYNNGMYFKLPYDDGGVVYYNYPYAEEQFDAYYDGEGENIILRIFEEGHAFMPDPPTFHNTEIAEPFFEPVYFQQIQVVLNYSELPENPTIQDFPPYNPYLVINQTAGREVHFANYFPSNSVDITWFDTEDDTSNPANDRYYVTISDLPWGIHIPSLFDHPLERISIIEAYPTFANWVNSGGSTHTDWYNNPVPSKVYNFIEQVENIFD